MKATNPEVIGILLVKLNPGRYEVFADVGCGIDGYSETKKVRVKQLLGIRIDHTILGEEIVLHGGRRCNFNRASQNRILGKVYRFNCFHEGNAITLYPVAVLMTTYESN